jgi:ABC-type spermidine/putrescine transport system permease subunit I
LAAVLEFSVDIGLIGPYFPSMVWPLYISISLIDDELISASRDLGASEWNTLRLVIFPLVAPGSWPESSSPPYQCWATTSP